MKIMSYEKIMAYVLMAKEIEMNPTQEPTKDQILIANEIHGQMEVDQNLKSLINNLISINNLADMRKMYTTYASGNQVPNVIPIEKKIEERSEQNYQGQPMQPENNILEPRPIVSMPKIFTKKIDRKAGYIDALVLALITGFAGGIMTTTILMMCK